MEIKESILIEYENRLHAFFLKHVKMKDIAEDFTQDILLKLWVNQQILQNVKDLDNYIFTMARHHVMDHFRRARLEHSYRTSLYETIQHNEPAAIKRLMQEDFNSRLHFILDTLPPRQKEVFELSKLHGLSHDEIAAKLNISNKTVRNHLFEAMKYLREKMQVDTIAFVSGMTMYFMA
ncbi:RNA polymerase sigma-70 factor [Membranicola marinus]|uniref:RNA polymerase sigma-70 factor n=1 Tax=Membranihabitans marinus TaxID=1227546 RepID=A0A953HJ95_9BACT|nr:RNA polymerase sigma-70 factor [Membranihabitans marinus]MBY5956889.1 RNA polymerase sigma-70 factor [Membranihabitans marinus]